MDARSLIQEILATSRLLAELDHDGFDGDLRLREELQRRRRELLDQLKQALPTPEADEAAALGADAQSATRLKVARPAQGKRRRRRTG